MPSPTVNHPAVPHNWVLLNRAPKQISAETMWIGSLGPRMFWGTRATNFSIYTTKMEGAGPQILGTGAKFKRVPCQKSCRVNRALTSGHTLPR